MPGKKIGALSFYRVIVVVQYSLITKHMLNKEKIAAENLLKRLQTVQMDRDIKIPYQQTMTILISSLQKYHTVH